LKNYLEPARKNDDNGNSLPKVQNIDLSTMARTKRRQHEMEQKKGVSPN
jgi:hypothetical protein